MQLMSTPIFRDALGERLTLTYQQVLEMELLADLELVAHLLETNLIIGLIGTTLREIKL
tara:strand:+ start:56 stop:232 length:177 start_codon:yes stop_codon:yes gene_type:complete